MENSRFPDDPVSRVEWINEVDLDANDYNPNFVLNPELRLLELSILKTGWVQPVLVSRERQIIDGYHRVMLSRDSPALRKKYRGFVPCVVMDVSRPDAMLLTIRMNRAKGQHMALKMSDIVHELINVHGLDRKVIAREIGGTKEEVDLLYQDSVFTMKDLKNYKYSEAWVPAWKDGRGREAKERDTEPESPEDR